MGIQRKYTKGDEVAVAVILFQIEKREVDTASGFFTRANPPKAESARTNQEKREMNLFCAAQNVF
jgi:hypothetical protein